MRTSAHRGARSPGPCPPTCGSQWPLGARREERHAGRRTAAACCRAAPRASPVQIARGALGGNRPPPRRRGRRRPNRTPVRWPPSSRRRPGADLPGEAHQPVVRPQGSAGSRQHRGAGRAAHRLDRASARPRRAPWPPRPIRGGRDDQARRGGLRSHAAVAPLVSAAPRAAHRRER